MLVIWKERLTQTDAEDADPDTDIDTDTDTDTHTHTGTLTRVSQIVLSFKCYVATFITRLTVDYHRAACFRESNSEHDYTTTVREVVHGRSSIYIYIYIHTQ